MHRPPPRTNRAYPLVSAYAQGIAKDDLHGISRSPSNSNRRTHPSNGNVPQVRDAVSLAAASFRFSVCSSRTCRKTEVGNPAVFPSRRRPACSNRISRRTLDEPKAGWPNLCLRIFSRILPRLFSPLPVLASTPQKVSPKSFPSSSGIVPVATSRAARSGFCKNFALTTSSMTDRRTASQSDRNFTCRPLRLAFTASNPAKAPLSAASVHFCA